MMPDLKEQISTARAEGYNDQQIVEYLSGKDARVKTALAEGHAPADIVAYLSGGSTSAAPPPAPNAPGFGATVGGAARDIAAGVGSSVWKSVFGGGDIIRRALGMERVIDRPEVQAAMTAPPGLAGMLGNVVGTGAQVIAGTPAATGWGGLAGYGALGSGAVAALQSGGDPLTTAGAAALGAVGNTIATPVSHVLRAALKPGPGVQQAWSRVVTSLVRGRPLEAAGRLGKVLEESKGQIVGTPVTSPVDEARKMLSDRTMRDAANIEVLQEQASRVAASLAAKGITPDQIGKMSAKAWQAVSTQNGGAAILPREYVIEAMPKPVMPQAPNLGFSGGSGSPGVFPAPYVSRAASAAANLPAKAIPSPATPTAASRTADTIIPAPAGTVGDPVTVKGFSPEQRMAAQDALVSKILDTLRRTRETRPDLALGADELTAAGKDQWAMLARAAQTNMPSAAAQKRIIETLRAEAGDLTNLLAESIKKAKKK